MTRREIFFIVSLVCLGIFILIGAYLWRENSINSKEMELNKENYSSEVEELQKKAATTEVTQDKSTENKTADPASTPKNQPTATTSGNTQNPQSNTAPPADNSKSFAVPECKVGDVVKLGGAEMVVTKSAVRHKIIDITIKGSTSDQPPKLIRSEKNRITYEIPADVDINVDVTEKTVTDKAPLVYNK